MRERAVRHEVVIVGAGLAGMTAAYELRDRDVLVLESEDRVGGRTLSGEHGDYWYNAGAQYVWDERTLALCEQLGLEVITADRALSAIYMRDRLAVARSPVSLLMKMPVSLAERTKFAATILRLRRLAARRPGLDPDLDAQSLAAIFGSLSESTREILHMVTESGTGLPPEDVSGAIGLGYAIHLFGGDVNATLKAVRGGTQRIAENMARAVGPERVLLGAQVESVRDLGDRVLVRYERGGTKGELEADVCVLALTAAPAREVAQDLPETKIAALGQMLPYTRIVSVAWLTSERRPMPWDRLLTVPALGLSFELFSHSAYFVRRFERSGRRPGGTFVTLSTGPRAEALWPLDDDELRDRLRGDLNRMFPDADDVIGEAEARVSRWHGLPRFRTGWLRHQAALREPSGRIYFCGDYTSQPGTPGAVKSGYHTARTVRSTFDRRSPSSGTSVASVPQP